MGRHPYGEESPLGLEWSPSGNVVESGSSKTVPASRKSTPCFSTFAVALPGSHAKTTQPVYLLAGADWAEHDGDGDCEEDDGGHLIRLRGHRPGRK
jgi:hypothetical protein